MSMPRELRDFYYDKFYIAYYIHSHCVQLNAELHCVYK